MTNLAERLSDGVKARGVKLSFGEPIRVAEGEVVGVSLVAYGFGGGNGGDGQGNAGEGGGGGGTAIPLGAYVAGVDGPVFQPNPIALIAALAPAIAAAGFALSRVIRALR